MKLFARTVGRYAASPNALFERIGEEGVILDTEREVYLALNESGTCVWDALTAGETPDAAASRLAERFQIPSEEALADTTALIQELVAQRLIVPAR